MTPGTTRLLGCLLSIGLTLTGCASVTESRSGGAQADDLADCRAGAHRAGIGAQILEVAAQAAIVGGLLMSALGGTRTQNWGAAGFAGLATAAASGPEAARRFDALVDLCMRERGHRAAPATLPSAATGQPIMPISALPAVDDAGPDKYQARQFAMQSRCHPQPVVTLARREPGIETYSVPCENGGVLMLQCQYGQCQPLR